MTDTPTAEQPATEAEAATVLRDLLDELLSDVDPEREWERLLDEALREAASPSAMALESLLLAAENVDNAWSEEAARNILAELAILARLHPTGEDR